MAREGTRAWHTQPTSYSTADARQETGGRESRRWAGSVVARRLGRAGVQDTSQSPEARYIFARRRTAPARPEKVVNSLARILGRNGAGNRVGVAQAGAAARKGRRRGKSARAKLVRMPHAVSGTAACRSSGCNLRRWCDSVPMPVRSLWTEYIARRTSSATLHPPRPCIFDINCRGPPQQCLR